MANVIETISLTKTRISIQKQFRVALFIVSVTLVPLFSLGISVYRRACDFQSFISRGSIEFLGVYASYACVLVSV